MGCALSFEIDGRVNMRNLSAPIFVYIALTILFICSAIARGCSVCLCVVGWLPVHFFLIDFGLTELPYCPELRDFFPSAHGESSEQKKTNRRS